jgi:hypothetical protein
MGKLGPGVFVLAMISYMLGGEGLDTSMIPTTLLWVAGLPFAYLIGLGVQILGELLGLHSASPAPRYILFYPTKFSANIDFDTRMALISKATDTQWTVYSKEQRERFIVLKEASSNMSIAVLIILVLAWSGLWGMNINVFCKVAGIVVVGVLYLSHRIHANRQANFETNVLEKVGLLSKEQAAQMKRAKWLT